MLEHFELLRPLLRFVVIKLWSSSVVPRAEALEGRLTERESDPIRYGTYSLLLYRRRPELDRPTPESRQSMEEGAEGKQEEGAPPIYSDFTKPIAVLTAAHVWAANR
ncbi:MAG: hypothetical protein ACHQ1H_07170 [Nitrososphaerales archaeon]